MPDKIPFFDLSSQVNAIRNDLEEAWNRVLESGRFLTGSEVKEFESEFSRWTGGKHAIACSSGTDALELLLRAWEVGAGDEVIVPANTWVSDAEVVVRTGATPVFADVNVATGLIDPEHIEPLISPRTKVLIVVHMYGTFCPIKPLMEITKVHGIRIIEDCAHAVGLRYKEGMAGNHADAAAFSFYPTKNLGALGDAGCVLTSNDTLAGQLRLLRDHGQPERDRHLVIGATCRMDELQAAFLRVKLKYIDQWNERRQALGAIFRQAVDENSRLVPGFDPQEECIYHLFVVRTAHREAFMNHLTADKIGFAIHYPQPIPITTAFRNVGRSSKIPNAIRRSHEILSLPVFPELTSHEVDAISTAIRHF